jgi:hypothetical protein
MIYRVRISRVAEYITRAVTESERGFVATFNDIGADMLEELRSIRRRAGRIPTCDYLGFFVATRGDGDAESFCEEVVEGGAAASTWRIADRLIGGHEHQREGVSLTVDHYLDGMEGIQGERWHQLAPNSYAGNDIGTPDLGPGVLIRDTRYWTSIRIPNQRPWVQGLILPAKDQLLHIANDQIDVAVRRWMATTAAWWTKEYLMAQGPRATVEGVIAAYPEPVTPSADGLVAIRALVREAQAGDPRWPSHVGFIGPDEWYRS